ncbi:P1 family peptidase [Salinarimonas sp. NSM]|uniref:P1 family peptidase n=1 Tax=Salinarimonas sp. NSM TaxID=3458003 RepID=UPI0040357F1E
MQTRPGPRNAITDVEGVLVGSAHDETVVTGATAVLFPTPNVGAVDVRGGSPATRETDVLRGTGATETIDAIALAGGSVHGLAAADGVVETLQARGRGFAVRDLVFPIVPAAAHFDFYGPGDKSLARASLYARLGARAAASADADPRLGNAGAGYGARAGKLKSGLGTASIVREDGVVVGVLLAANPTGSVLMPGTDAFWAWSVERDGEFGGRRPPPDWSAPATPPLGGTARERASTVIGVVATNLALTRPQLERVAAMAHDGLARAIVPVHMPEDGDVLFAVSTGALAKDVDLRDLGLVGALAADVVARAVARAVYCARTLDRLEGYRARIGETE